MKKKKDSWKKRIPRLLSWLLTTALVLPSMAGLFPMTASAAGTSHDTDAELAAQWEELQGIIGQYYGEWGNTAPIPENNRKAAYERAVVNSIPSTALLGNGDIGVSADGNYEGGSKNEKTVRIGKSDFWTTRGNQGSIPLTVGGVTIRQQEEVVNLNVALGANIIGNSEFNDNGVQGANLLVDGKIATKWGSAAGSEDKITGYPNGGQWAVIDLGEKKNIDRYVLQHAGNNNEPNHNTKEWKLQYLETGDIGTWSKNTVKAIGEGDWKDLDHVTDNPGNNTGTTTDKTVPATEARYIRLLIIDAAASDSKNVRLHELELYEVVEKSGNIALNAPIKVDSVNNDGGDQSGPRMLDGNLLTKWCSQNINASTPHWAIIDLGAVYDIDRYVLQHAGNNNENTHNTRSWEVQWLAADNISDASADISVTSDTTDETAAPEAADETADPEAADETAAPEAADETAAPEATDETADPEADDETANPEADDTATAPEADNAEAAPETDGTTVVPATGDTAADSGKEAVTAASGMTVAAANIRSAGMAMKHSGVALSAVSKATAAVSAEDDQAAASTTLPGDEDTTIIPQEDGKDEVNEDGDAAANPEEKNTTAVSEEADAAEGADAADEADVADDADAAAADDADAAEDADAADEADAADDTDAADTVVQTAGSIMRAPRAGDVPEDSDAAWENIEEIADGNWVTFDSVTDNTPNDAGKTTDITLKAPIKARYVRVLIHAADDTADSNHTVRLHEFELYKAVSVNIAPTKIVVSSNNNHQDFPPERAVNGTVLDGENFSARYEGWVSNVGTVTSETPENTVNYWLAMEFEEPVTIGRWRVVHDNGSRGAGENANATKDFALQISTDNGNTYTDVDKVTGNSAGVTDRDLNEPITAQYVRLAIYKPGQNDNEQSPRARIPQFELYPYTSAVGDGTPVEPPAPPSDFYEKQNILEARMETTTTIAGTPLQITTWTPATANYIIQKVEIKEGHEAPGKLRVYNFTPYTNDYPTVSAVDAGLNTASVSRTTANPSNNYDKAIGWRSEVVLNTKVIGATDLSVGTVEEGETRSYIDFTVTPGTTAYVVTAVGGGGRTYRNAEGTDNYNVLDPELGGQTPAQEAAAMLTAIGNEAAIDSLLTDHAAWWKDYWMKSYVKLNPADATDATGGQLDTIEKYYYGAQYLLGSSIREGNQPPGLFAHWRTNDTASWNGDYHLNYNFISTWYGSASSNRPEQLLSAIKALNDYIPEARKNAEVTDRSGTRGIRNIAPDPINTTTPDRPAYGSTAQSYIDYRLAKDAAEGVTTIHPTDGIQGGLLFPVGVGPWGSAPDAGFHNEAVNGPFSVWPMVEYYNYTQDKEFLEEDGYAMIKGTAIFGTKWLEEYEPGKYRLLAGYNEGSWSLNPAVELAAYKMSLENAIKASEILGVDDELREEWQDVRAGMPEQPKVMSQGNNLTELALCFALAEKEFNKETRTWGDLGSPLPGDGNIIPLESIIPSGQVGYYSPEEDLQAARNTILRFGNNAWSTINNFPKGFPVAVRVGFDINTIVERFSNQINNQLQRANLWINDNNHGIEKAGAIEAVNSMFIIGDEDIVKVFPNWVAGKAAEFHRLRAPGAFVVSAGHDGTEVSSLKVTSEAGGTLTLASPWADGIVVKDSNGTVIPTVRGTAPNHEDEITYAWETTEGMTYSVTKGFSDTVTEVKVSSLTGVTQITADGGTLQMLAAVSPAAADNTVTWTVTEKNGEPTDKATIAADGLLTAVKNGTVTVKAAAKDGSGISGTMDILIRNQSVKVEGITISSEADANTITENGGTLQFTADVEPVTATNTKVTWASSAPGVAYINQEGLLTAAANGTVTVTASARDGSGKVSEAFTVTVSGQSTGIPVTGITITGPSAIRSKGGSAQFTAVIEPAGATNKSVTWSLSGTEAVTDNEFASISPAGVLTAKKNGTVYVTATANDGSNVKAAEPKAVTITGNNTLVQSITVIGQGNAGRLNGLNSTLQMVALITPADATNQAVSWSVDDESIATVNAETGLLTAHMDGTVEVTAKAKDDGGRQGTKAITVTGTGNIFVPLDSLAITPDKVITFELGTDNITKELSFTKAPGNTNVPDSDMKWTVNYDANSITGGIDDFITLVSSGNKATITAVDHDDEDGDGEVDEDGDRQPAQPVSLTVQVYSESNPEIYDYAWVTILPKAADAETKELEIEIQEPADEDTYELAEGAILADGPVNTKYNILSAVYAEGTEAAVANPTVKWTSSNTKVVMVNQRTGELTVKGTGSAFVTATGNKSRQPYHKQTARVKVTVRDTQPKTPAAVVVYGTSDGTGFTLLPSDNFSFDDVIILEGDQTKAVRGSLKNAEFDFTLEKNTEVEDGTSYILKKTTEASGDDPDPAITKNRKVTLALQAQKGGDPVGIPFPLVVQVKMTAPVFSVKMPALNTFWDDGTASGQILLNGKDLPAVAGYTLGAVNEDINGDVTKNFEVDSATGIISAKEGVSFIPATLEKPDAPDDPETNYGSANRSGKLAVKGELTIKFADGTKAVTKPVTVAVKNVLPKLKLAATAVTLRKDGETWPDGKDATFTLTGGQLASVNKVAYKGTNPARDPNGGIEDEILSYADATFTVTLKDTAKASNALQLEAWLENARMPIVIKPAVKTVTPARVSYKLSATSMTFNQQFKDQVRTVSVVPSAANMTATIADVEEVKGAKVAPHNLEIDPSTWDDGTVTVRVPDEGVIAKTYKFRIKIAESTKTFTLSVRVDKENTQKPQRATVKAGKEKIDLLNRRGTAMTYTPTIKSTASRILDVKVIAPAKEDKKYPNGYKNFYAEWDEETQKVILKAYEDPGVADKNPDEWADEDDIGRLVKNASYKLGLEFTLEDGSGTITNSANKITTGDLTVKPSQSAVKYTLENTYGMYQSRTGGVSGIGEQNGLIRIDLSKHTPAYAVIDQSTFTFKAERRSSGLFGLITKWSYNPGDAYWYSYNQANQELLVWIKDSARVKVGKATLVFSFAYEGQGYDDAATRVKGIPTKAKSVDLRIPVTIAK